MLGYVSDKRQIIGSKGTGVYASAPSSHPASGRQAAKTTTAPHIVNAMTIDVEDYFQVEAFKGVITRSNWETTPMRVEANTDLLLQLLSDAGVSATFFVLGWVAERLPAVVQRIAAAGHEIASHGSEHERADHQAPGVFRDDVTRAKAVLEDQSGARVRGYRAPTFSIGRDNWWVYDVLGEAGYDYSSSLYPIAHDLYGVPDAPRVPFRPTSSPLLEIPMTTVKLLGRNIPCSGGGYFRLLPYGFSRWALDRVNNHEGRAGIFYCHPWEFDAGQPRIEAASTKSKLRHYTNIASMPSRLKRLLKDFSWDRMDNVFLGTGV